MAARIPMMATTIISSSRVKPNIRKADTMKVLIPSMRMDTAVKATNPKMILRAIRREDIPKTHITKTIMKDIIITTDRADWRTRKTTIPRWKR